jgi:hypothetical protein
VLAATILREIAQMMSAIFTTVELSLQSRIYTKFCLMLWSHKTADTTVNRRPSLLPRYIKVASYMRDKYLKTGSE